MKKTRQCRSTRKGALGMGELAIRRNRGAAVPRYPVMDKMEKTAGGSRKTAPSPGFSVSETLQQLMTRAGRLESHVRESRRTLRTGEAALAEVRDSLDRIAELIQESAGGGEPDRDALQSMLERLREEIDRVISSASAGETRLFLDEEMGDEESMDALLQAVMGEGDGKESNIQALPQWLLRASAGEAPSPEQLLSALGLDESASGAELLAAVTGSSLEGGSAAGYLAVLYLGSVIASSSGTSEEALEGLRQLLARVAEGASPDEAIEELTNGVFTSFEDFQEQFTNGTAPGLEDFLAGLLLSGGESSAMEGSSILALLAGLEGTNTDLLDLDLMLGLINAVQSSGSHPEAEADGTELANGANRTEEASFSPASVVTFGDAQAIGRDLSGVTFDESTGEWTVRGTADVVLRGVSGQRVFVTGSGTVTLQNVSETTLVVDSAEAKVFSAGENALSEVHLRQGVSLTLGGGGLLRISAFHCGGSNTLRLTEGAVTLTEGGDKAPPGAPGTHGAPGTRGALGTLPLPVILEGPASLAARADSVSSPSGKPLTPFDIVWKTLLPGWSGITAATVDGKQARMTLSGGDLPDPARLWLEKVDPSHGSPVHTAVIRGKDAQGRPKIRYTYLRWSQYKEEFEEITMYPNPFRVTGGEESRDWFYNEEDHTLYILSNQVTAVSGGSGIDANRAFFSGRIALADGIGAMELVLEGVSCQVTDGRAFSLGRENDVTLILRTGTDNRFESGEGCAGISIGEGTSLRIDRDAPPSGGIPAGTLSASGSGGGAGIGRDGGKSRDRTSRILVCGGVITALGEGGGAGIGAGKYGCMGPITIMGGAVNSTGGNGGGAGIGGALGASVGDISIRGGTVTAVAVFHAAAIGAGIQGGCGDILITGTARIVKAMGGNPGADIGGCLFGSCGKVEVSRAVDIGRARLWKEKGVSLQMGEDVMTLPQFRLSSKALQLDKLRVSTREAAKAAKRIIDADRRWVAQIQVAYSALYNRLEQSGFSVQPYINTTEGPVRDTAKAGTLLEDMRQSIPRQPSEAMCTHGKKGRDGVGQLLR